ncbi:EAL domain-containing protein [Ideonella sp. 4Y11]|uniref:EAL domain-containing protein n=1 Tax=Ideonella aquatica TaxID=2824119 RepID=A0A940YXF7_9BURK|nr:EAL domain-containing protein [Ideonella aquatica]MBQ0960970.1 EAL domain-containing protein [Ideonella aquatica]
MPRSNALLSKLLARRPRTVVWGALALLASMIASLAVMGLWQSRLQHQARAEAQSQNLATLTDAYLAAHLNQLDQSLLGVVHGIEASLALRGRIEPAEAASLIEAVQGERPDLSGVYLVDAAGRIVGGGLGVQAADLDQSDQPWFQALRQQAHPGLQVAAPRLSLVGDGWVLPFGRRVNGPDGQPAGAVLATMQISHLSLLLSRVDAGPGGVVVLRSAALHQIVRYPALAGDSGRIGRQNASPELRALVARPDWRVVNYHTGQTPDGVTRTYAVRRMSAAPLLVLVGLAEQDTLAGWQRELRTTLALVASFLLLLSGAGLMLVRALARGEEARQRARLLTAVFEHSGEAIVVTDADNHIVEVNPAFVQQTGYTPDEVVGRNPRLLASGHTRPDEYEAMWASLTERGQWRGELLDRHRDGRVSPKWMSISVVRDAQGAVTHHIAQTMDLSELKAAEQRILHLAHHDHLTGLPNRVLLRGRLEQALAAAQRGDSELAMLFIDLDRFKDINDSLGHHVGDAMLVEVAQRLQALVRGSDIVARLGGDEFVLVLTELGDEGARASALVAQKVLEALRQPVKVEGHALHTSASIGIAMYPSDGDDMDALMKGADAAMYHAKAAGRDGLHFYTAAMNQDNQERLALEQGLRVAIDRQELFLQYQPQIEAGGLRTVTVEALLRWRHPSLGLVSPVRFIPIAEDTGLIASIGRWVLHEALRQLALWRAQGHTSLRVAVNVSAQQLRDDQFAVAVADALVQHGVPGGALELEVTESTAMRDPRRTIAQLQQLRQLGVGLSIDDFGTGYSSLAYLKQLPLNSLKLDRSFVMDIEHDANDAAICAATITLAHSLGLEVVAEGVETRAQLDYLRGLGCDLVQGYLFAKPLDPDACQGFIEAQLAPTP